MINMVEFKNDGYIWVARSTNGELFEERGFEIKDSFILKKGEAVGELHSQAMGIDGIMYADGGNGAHVQVNGNAFKIEDITLDNGDYMTIDLGGRKTYYKNGDRQK